MKYSRLPYFFKVLNVGISDIVVRLSINFLEIILLNQYFETIKMTILSNRVCDVIGNVTNSHSVPSLNDTFRGTGTFLAICSSLRHTYSNERKGFF